MQRLFTTFPNGWPGAGLLLLRVVSAVPIFLDCLSMVSDGSAPTAAWLRLSGLLPATAVLFGAWTPVAALLMAVVELSFALSTPGCFTLYLTRAAIGLALVGLGPGAWSLDSRRYGRKRIEL
jgi:putative oxidoreductase